MRFLIDSLEVLISVLVLIWLCVRLRFALSRYGGEFGVCTTGCIDPKQDHWKNKLEEFKVQSPLRILIGY